MATKKKASIRLDVKKGRAIEGSKLKLYDVHLKKGSEKIRVGEFLAKTEADARKKARTEVRKDIA